MGSATKRKAQHHDPVDVTKRVVAARYCIECGADLRGASIEGVCPTCRHPIYDSVYGGYLIDAHPFEPRRLHDMSNMVFYPALFLSGLTVIALLASLCTVCSVVDAVEKIFDVGFFFAMLSPLIALVGVVVFTGRHSVNYYRAKYGNPRHIVGLSGIVLCGVAVVCVSVWYFGQIASAAVQVAFVTLPAGLFLERLGALLRRIPSKKLAMYARLTLALNCALGAAALAILVLRRFAAPASDLSGFVIALTLLTDLGGLALGVVTLRLLYFARRALRAIYG